MEMKLLNLNFAACSSDLLSDLVSLFLGNALFESLGSVVNEVLSFLKTKAGDFTSNLDNSKLLSACRLQNSAFRRNLYRAYALLCKGNVAKAALDLQRLSINESSGVYN